MVLKRPDGARFSIYLQRQSPARFSLSFLPIVVISHVHQRPFTRSLTNGPNTFPPTQTYFAALLKTPFVAWAAQQSCEKPYCVKTLLCESVALFRFQTYHSHSCSYPRLLLACGSFFFRLCPKIRFLLVIYAKLETRFFLTASFSSSRILLKITLFPFLIPPFPIFFLWLYFSEL